MLRDTFSLAENNFGTLIAPRVVSSHNNEASICEHRECPSKALPVRIRSKLWTTIKGTQHTIIMAETRVSYFEAATTPATAAQRDDETTVLHTVCKDGYTNMKVGL